jgi:hypothetical protein
MPKENDLEGHQDQGGKHGGQAGMPRPTPRPGTKSDQSVDQPGQKQPRDGERTERARRAE